MPVTAFDLISAPSLRNSRAVRDYFKFRQSVFNEQQHYGMPSWNGMEHDEHDTIAACHMVRYGDNGTILGCIRATPTKYEGFDQSMIYKSFRDTVDSDFRHGERVIEGSRIGVHPELSHDPKLRERVVSELILALHEFCLLSGAEKQICLMPPALWRIVFEKRGWPTRQFPNPHYYGPGEKDFVVAGEADVSKEILQNMRLVTGIREPVIAAAPEMEIVNRRTGRMNDYAEIIER